MENLNSAEAIREAVRKRDNYQCQNCGIKQEDHRTRLEVHRKIAGRSGGTYTIDNCITLCRRCHRIAETAMPDYPKYDRPVMPEEEKLSQVLTVRLSTEDYQCLVDAANRDQRKLSDWCRLVALDAAKEALSA